jgi:hypothetical protein
MDANAKYSARELASWFADPQWATRFPPILNPGQAADLLQVPLQTVYDWSSRGLLDGCKARVGKHLRLARDRLLDLFFNGKLHEK